MQKKPTPTSVPSPRVLNGQQQFDSARYAPKPVPLLGHAALLRHPVFGRGAQTVAALIVGTYAVDDRYVVVQAFPIGKQTLQLADVQLLDDDPGETNDAVAWLVK